MDLSVLRERLRTGELDGSYMLAGEEDYLKKYYLSQIRECVLTDPMLAPFNHVVMEGEDIDFSALYDAVTAPPVMSERKLVEWRYPALGSLTKAERESLTRVLEAVSENAGTVLVFLVADGAVELGTERRPSEFVRTFGEAMGIINFPISTEAQLISWLRKHFESESISVTPAVCSALISQSGRSMTVLNNEVTKLCAYARASGRSSISEAEVAEVASYTSQSEEYALSNAILTQNRALAYRSLEDMRSKRVAPMLVLGMLSRVFSDLVAVSYMLAEGMRAQDVGAALGMSEYKLKLYIAAAKRRSPESLGAALAEICEADAASKFGGVSGYLALELLIGKCF